MGMFEKDFTLAYYNKHADSFIDDTENVDFHEMQDIFLTCVPKGGLILDMGCGSGRDSKYFLSKGYSVEAFDGSLKMCERAHELTGLDIRCVCFEDWQADKKYDAVWACSSLLHLDDEDLIDIMNRVYACLKNDGIFYSSFKYGDFKGMRSGRFFNDFNEGKMRALLKRCSDFKIVKIWQTADVRAGRENEKWLNLLLSKKQ